VRYGSAKHPTVPHTLEKGYTYYLDIATSQEAYEEAVTELFQQLDRWEMVLEQQHYLCGEIFEQELSWSRDL
jgi:putative glutathione S-transferase